MSPREARARGAHVLGVVVQVAAVGIASVAMLLRVPGRPAWRTIFGDDYFWFLTGAIQHPWHWSAYGGYVQVLPRFIAQVVSYLPLTDASLAFALAGVVVAACGALVIFHASAGHIESVKLRALLAAALVLLPIAPMELIGSGVRRPGTCCLSCSGRCCGGRGRGPRWRWRRRSGSSRWLPISWPRCSHRCLSRDCTCCAVRGSTR